MPAVRLRRSVHSIRCSRGEYFNNTEHECVRCEKRFTIKAGFEFTSNCGLSDDGGRQERLYRECRQGTFNDGKTVECQQCSTCQGPKLASYCTTTSDSHCCGEGEPVEKGECKDSSQTSTTRSTAVTTVQPTTSPTTTSKTTEIFLPTSSAKTTQTHPTKTTQTNRTPSSQINNHSNHDPWIGSVAVTSIILLFAGLICVIYFLKRRNCRVLKRHFSDKRNHIHLEGSNERLKAESTKDLLDINTLLSQEIQSTPLQSVLNNQDVVDELVLLLDPDTPGAKNTRHLAANCSIPFPWINYAYSMREIKSPLVAVLEKVIAKNPNWNVGQLAGLLSNIERNDAVAVLAKITVTEDEV